MMRKTFTRELQKQPFKERFGNHTRNLKHPKYRNSAKLSKYIWKLKDANIPPVIEWSIVTKVLSKTIKVLQSFVSLRNST